MIPVWTPSWVCRLYPAILCCPVLLLSGPTTTLHLECSPPKNRWTDIREGEHQPVCMYMSLSLWAGGGAGCHSNAPETRHSFLRCRNSVFWQLSTKVFWGLSLSRENHLLQWSSLFLLCDRATRPTPLATFWTFLRALRVFLGTY